jgi:Ca2+/Na+ antiporter
MDKKLIKPSLKMVSNVLLFISLGLMVLNVWLENEYYISVAAIAISVVGLLVTLFSHDGPFLKIFVKELNIYFFVVCLIVGFSVILDAKVLFYIGMVLFILVIVLYLIPLFVTEKEDKKQKGKKK